MLKRLDLRGVSGDLRTHLPRPQIAASPTATVQAVLAAVRADGDAALRRYTEQFDGVTLDDLRVSHDELANALDSLEPPLRQALEAARDAVDEYHRHERRPDTRFEAGGMVVESLRRPVDRAGIYVPGGRAGYPSTVIMSVVPAQVAGVGEVVICVPPASGQNSDRTTLAAAALCGVTEVYRVGGAQAIGAMAYGTESIRSVDVIVGPGNVYVAVAKREVAAQGVVGVPAAFAGPSEVVVIADESTPTEWAAIDVVVQAEHGPDGLAWLVTWSSEVADEVTAAVERVVVASPRRADLEATLREGGYAVVVDGPEKAVEVANGVAPEHLQLMCAEPDRLLPLVRHAGAVFCGPWSPASIGDYVAGPSHVLPTFGSARFAGGLGTEDFVRTIHAITLDESGFASRGSTVRAIAEAEGLPAHGESIRIRSAKRDAVSPRADAETVPL